MKKETRKLLRLQDGRIIDFLHSYFYFKWTSVYLRIVRFVLYRPGLFPKVVYEGAGKRLMQSHHAKVITNSTAKRLIDVKEPIRIKNPENVIPFEKARDIVVENSEHIAVIDCPCRQIRKDSCKPIDVCFVLGEPLVDFVLEQKKDNAKRLSLSEALEIIEREHKRGRIHTAWFKDVAGNRLYSICNCCSCCCLGFQAIKFGFDLIAPSGYVATVDENVCVGCSSCVKTCHFGAISVKESRREIEINALKSTSNETKKTSNDFEPNFSNNSNEIKIAMVDNVKCMGCGVCVSACSKKAIKLHESNDKIKPMQI